VEFFCEPGSDDFSDGLIGLGDVGWVVLSDDEKLGVHDITS